MRLALFAAVLVMSMQAEAATLEPTSFSAKVVHVVDGDTFRVVPDGGCRPTILCPLTIRVYGIDTPESRSGGGLGGAKCDKEKRLGVIVKAWAKQKMFGATVIVSPLAEQTDPRGRMIAAVALPTGTDYAALAIRTGRAQAYDPAKAKDFVKPDWCT
jgi:endonuclease YncB( thermonuclease family)